MGGKGFNRIMCARGCSSVKFKVNNPTDDFALFLHVPLNNCKVIEWYVVRGSITVKFEIEKQFWSAISLWLPPLDLLSLRLAVSPPHKVHTKYIQSLK